MARTQATIFSSCWDDPDWLALPADAQRLYWLLLSQRKLTLAGCLDLFPARWAPLCADWTEDDVIGVLDALVDARFVVIDGDELVIRTFVKSDLAKANQNLVKGMWGAWQAILSPVLRKVVVDAMPDEVFDKVPTAVPAEAEVMRTEPRLGLPLGQPSEPPFERASEPAPEPSVVSSLLSADCSAQGLRSTNDPTEQDKRKAAALVARLIAENDPTARNVDAVAATVRKDILQGPDPARLNRITDALGRGLTPEQVADTWNDEPSVMDHPIFGKVSTNLGPEGMPPRLAEFRGHVNRDEGADSPLLNKGQAS